ncbi:MAG: T9SS type A sorting domain-containing protein [Candidatus Desantisbacteria bacterium]
MNRPKIYNIAGELVKEIEVTKSPQDWNILNESIASGIYIYTVTGGNGGMSVGKMGIVK